MTPSGAPSQWSWVSVNQGVNYAVNKVWMLLISISRSEAPLHQPWTPPPLLTAELYVIRWLTNFVLLSIQRERQENASNPLNKNHPSIDPPLNVSSPQTLPCPLDRTQCCSLLHYFSLLSVSSFLGKWSLQWCLQSPCDKFCPPPSKVLHSKFVPPIHLGSLKFLPPPQPQSWTELQNVRICMHLFWDLYRTFLRSRGCCHCICCQKSFPKSGHSFLCEV